MAFRRRRANPLDEIDLESLPPTTRRPVERALRAHGEFAGVVGSVPSGPLRDHLGALGGRLDAGVLAVWHVAGQMASIDRVTASLDTERVTAELKQARRSGAPDETIAALQARFATTQRLLNGRDERAERLDVLITQLDTAVGHAAELALTSAPGSGAAMTALEHELSDVVGRLDALVAATAELPTV